MSVLRGACAGAVLGAFACTPAVEGSASPGPTGSIAPAAVRAESAGAEQVPQRHRGKIAAPFPEVPGTEDDDAAPPPPKGVPHHAPPPPGGMPL